MKESQRKIAIAFIELLNHKDLEDLRVHEVILKARTSKATFYRCFQDKYDVMHWIIQYQIDKIVAASPKITNWSEWLTMLLKFFRDYKDTFRHIVQYEGQNSFTDFLLEYSIKLVSEKIRSENHDVDIDDLMFPLRLFTSGCVYMIKEWISEGCAADVDQVAHSIARSVPAPLVPYMEMKF